MNKPPKYKKEIRQAIIDNVNNTTNVSALRELYEISDIVCKLNGERFNLATREEYAIDLTLCTMLHNKEDSEKIDLIKHMALEFFSSSKSA